MDGYGIDQKIRFGYAKASKKLGSEFSLYRATSPLDPLDAGNFQGVVKCVFTVAWDWMKANKPGNAIWNLLTDGQDSSGILNVSLKDFLVSGTQTFFVLAKQYQMPMLGVECNATIKIIRPSQSTAIGALPYGGYTPDGSETLVIGMPCSNLIDRVGQNSKVSLPTSTKDSTWNILMPSIGDIEIRTGDIAIDQDSQNYLIGSTELTDFGWRMKTVRMVT